MRKKRMMRMNQSLKPAHLNHHLHLGHLVQLNHHKKQNMMLKRYNSQIVLNLTMFAFQKDPTHGFHLLQTSTGVVSKLHQLYLSSKGSMEVSQCIIITSNCLYSSQRILMVGKLTHSLTSLLLVGYHGLKVQPLMTPIPSTSSFSS